MEDKQTSREQVVVWMQQTVENFDFESFYPREFKTGKHLYECPAEGSNPTVIKQDERTVKDCINMIYKVYSHRALNLIFAHYKFTSEDINPNMAMRFDVREIKDILTFRMGPEKKDHWIVAACGDG